MRLATDRQAIYVKHASFKAYRIPVCYNRMEEGLSIWSECQHAIVFSLSFIPTKMNKMRTVWLSVCLCIYQFPAL